MKIEFYEDSNGKYRWRMKAGNGRIVGESRQGFVLKDRAENNLSLVLYDGSHTPRSEWSWV